MELIAIALTWAGLAFILLGFGLIIAGLFKVDKELQFHGDGMCAVGWWLWFLSDVMGGFRTAVVSGLMAILYSWLWWKNRRNRKRRRALRDLGAKSRARIEAMVRQMTPSPIPSPAGV